MTTNKPSVFYTIEDKGEHIEADMAYGYHIAQVIEAAISIAKERSKPVRFEFNDVTVEVTDSSVVSDVYGKWAADMETKRAAYWTPERTAEAEKRRAVAETKAAAQAARLAAVRAKCPHMTLASGKETDWQAFVAANKDGYGGRCVSYAEDWALLLEEAIAASPGADPAAVVRDQAKALSHEADHDGITGFMYGAAVLMLAQCWVHGESLRRWHNLDIQTGHEGEKANESGSVLNPALLSVG